MEVKNLAHQDKDEHLYTSQYNKLHIDILELKVKEKDQLLSELSSINKELYQEMSNLQKMLQISKDERDTLLEESINIKDQLVEKNTYIASQETIISKLRSRISEITNGASFSLEEKSLGWGQKEHFLQELKTLQNKYDNREDLVISLQNERVKLLNDIDKLRYKCEILDQVCRIVDVQPGNVVEFVKRYRVSQSFPVAKDNSLDIICQKIGCKNFDELVKVFYQMEAEIGDFKLVFAKVKRYFHLQPGASLEELDRYVGNLIV
ncbi:hypothetical protein SteCoe_18276 [Stentor coeruleus]|uniref:Uncharacterized protein n=1 Tax=Stentor coeruleus TaxID=5963 RepID=A0A1R2BWZ3_9CILI|nr:hypothetical protein SteCoe_18276 [Stentor coeruleus]